MMNPGTTSSSNCNPMNIVYQIGPFDVIMGRGSPITDNPGNANLRQLVSERHTLYMQAVRQKEKHDVAVSIVQHIRAQGGKFLRKNTPRSTSRGLQQPQQPAVAAATTTTTAAVAVSSAVDNTAAAAAAQQPSFMEAPDGWIVVINEKEIVGKVRTNLSCVLCDGTVWLLSRHQHKRSSQLYLVLHDTGTSRLFIVFLLLSLSFRSSNSCATWDPRQWKKE